MKACDNIGLPLQRSMPPPGWRGCPERRAAAYSAAPNTETESCLTDHSELTWTVTDTHLLRTCLRTNTHKHVDIWTLIASWQYFIMRESTGAIHSICTAWLTARHRTQFLHRCTAVSVVVFTILNQLTSGHIDKKGPILNHQLVFTIDFTIIMKPTIKLPTQRDTGLFVFLQKLSLWSSITSDKKPFIWTWLTTIKLLPHFTCSQIHSFRKLTLVVSLLVLPVFGGATNPRNRGKD